jgi:hypothetical protein
MTIAAQPLVAFLATRDAARARALGWKVPDVARAIADVRSRGVTFERYEFMEQDPSGAWTPPDGARVARFKDGDGDTLSIRQDAKPERA